MTCLSTLTNAHFLEQDRVLNRKSDWKPIAFVAWGLEQSFGGISGAEGAKCYGFSMYLR